MMHTFQKKFGFTSTSEERRGNLWFPWRPSDVEAKAPRAFTLIETLVAISVLLISLAGPLSIASQALSTAYYARDQVVAFYLAQEGIEYVRAVRDQNYLPSTPLSWLTGIDESAPAGKNCISSSCTIDVPNFTHATCAGTCPTVLINTSGVYNHAGGSASLFTRTLRITRVSADEVIVKVTISWTSSNINRSFQLSDHLFNWL